MSVHMELKGGIKLSFARFVDACARNVWQLVDDPRNIVSIYEVHKDRQGQAPDKKIVYEVIDNDGKWIVREVWFVLVYEPRWKRLLDSYRVLNYAAAAALAKKLREDSKSTHRVEIKQDFPKQWSNARNMKETEADLGNCQVGF